MEKTISNDGTSIAFERTGIGPALVLVDGAFCYRNNGVSPRLVPLLSNHFTVYSYDRRGRGESTDTEPYTIDKEIEDLKAVIEKTGEVPYVCGFSSGACLLLLAMEKGINVKRIALFEPPFVVASPGEKAPPGDAVMKISHFVKQGKSGAAVKYFMTKVMGMPGFIVFMFRVFGKASWEKNESVAKTLAYDITVMGNYSVPEKAAASVRVPAIVIGGDKSPNSLKNAVIATGKSIPNGQVSLLEGQSHNVSMKVLAPILKEFFKE